MFQGEVVVTSLTPPTLPLLFISYEGKPMVKKDPLVLSVVSSLKTDEGPVHEKASL